MGEWWCSFTILNLGTGWEWPVSRLCRVQLKKITPDTETGWVSGLVWTLQRKETLLPHPDIELRFIGLPARILIAVLTEL
jgi:hypothetical protein